MLWQEHVAGVAEAVPMEALVQQLHHFLPPPQKMNCHHHPENRTDENVIQGEHGTVGGTVN